MIANHQVLLYVVAFDLYVGILLARYVWLIGGSIGRGKVPLAWIAIICLVNLGGTFCAANVEKPIAFIGGLAIAILIVPAIMRQRKANRNA